MSKDKDVSEEHLLDDLAPKRKPKVVRKKYHSNKYVNGDVAARRQAAAEAHSENPLPRAQKDAILMKYGVTPTVVERDTVMPLWKARYIRDISERPVEVVWNSLKQDWLKATKGLVPTRPSSARGRGYTRPTSSNLPNTRVTPYPKKFQDRSQPNSNRHTSGRTGTSTNSRPNSGRGPTVSRQN